MDFKSRAINHALLILYEHLHIMTIQNVEFCEIPFIGYLVMTQFTDFLILHQFKVNNSLHTGAILTKCEMHSCVMVI